MTNVEVKDRLDSIIRSKTDILDRCFFTLLPKNYKKRGHGLLTKEITENLELEFKIDISDVVDEASIVLFTDTLKLSGLDNEDLIDTALYNTPIKQPPKFDSIGGFIPIDGLDDLPIYVLTNTKMVFGAGVILYDGMYEKLSKIVGRDFTVIPSSVHETIIVPSEIDCLYLSKIITEVNATVVSPDEILSDRPYKLTPAGDLIEA